VSNGQSKPQLWNAEQLRLAVEAAGVTLWSWNVDTDQLKMDDRAFDLWGIPRSNHVTFEDLSAHIHLPIATGFELRFRRLA
jgi:PAS domain-containing protein